MSERAPTTWRTHRCPGCDGVFRSASDSVPRSLGYASKSSVLPDRITSSAVSVSCPYCDRSILVPVSGDDPRGGSAPVH
jgi:hypothetical protein